MVLRRPSESAAVTGNLTSMYGYATYREITELLGGRVHYSSLVPRVVVGGGWERAF
jgi:hypothetical protein